MTQLARVLSAAKIHTWTFLAIALGAAIGAGGMALAHHTGTGEVKVTQLSQRDIIETLDGKAASATVVEVAFEPGQHDSPHGHTGPVFGYVLEGQYEHAIDDEPVKTYKAGDTFYEPSGSVHRVARNPSSKTRARLLAVILHSRDTKEVTVPEKVQESRSWGVTDRLHSQLLDGGP
jgi:quercetin dioxygenase-like cupin family protein